MISRETRARGLLRQLSRARPMTAAGLVSDTHMQLGSHGTVPHVRNVSFTSAGPFTRGDIFRSIMIIMIMIMIIMMITITIAITITLIITKTITIIIIIKSPGFMMKICWIKGYFNRTIVVFDRVPICKSDMCSSVFLLADLTRSFALGFAGRLRNQIRTIRKVKWLWKADTQFISSSISRNIT